MALTIGSLFSGIGGLELGLERAGLGRVLWQAEVDPFCRQVLARHWPDARRYEDVREVDERAERPDVICGGFPCQDISLAGTGRGLAGERSGLWREYARVVRVLRPRYVVVENVAALLARGFGDVLGDLAACGYDAVWDCIPAQAVGAPHRRDRLFLVAWLADADGGGLQGIGFACGEPGHGGASRHEPDGCNLPLWPPAPDDLLAWGRVQADAQPAFCKLADGLPARLVRDRRNALKALGNAVVPAVGEVVGRVVLDIERSST